MSFAYLLCFLFFSVTFLPSFASQDLDNFNLESYQNSVKQKQDEQLKQNPALKKILTKIGKWTVLSAVPNGKKMCYAVLYPLRRTGNLVSSDDKPHLQINYFSRYSQRIAIYFDYKLRSNLKISVSLDGKQIHMQQQSRQFAIIADRRDEIDAILLVRKSNTLIVRGEGSDGIYTIDEYNLNGISGVYDFFDRKC